MVEVANASTVDLLPVDGEGVWLPGEDLSQKQKESLPCLAGVDRRPIQPVGHPWGDARVVDGAAIAAARTPGPLPAWQQLKLYRIQPTAQTPSPGGAPLAGQGRRMSFTRERARGSFGAVQPPAPPRANRPRRKRRPGSCSMRPSTGVSTPGRRWMSAGCRRQEQRSRERIASNYDSWRRAKRQHPRGPPAPCRP